LIPDAFIPPYATHTSGAGAIVISPKNEILLVNENVRHNSFLYKLPGGLLEQNEHIASAVIREVFEETRIQTAIESIVGLGQVHGWQFQ
jgi:ADP-ribose pyrophosphatase YjhB (NUDIX family)